MIKIIVVSHGSLAQALVETSQLIVGAPTDIDVLGLFHEDSINDFKDKVSNLIEKNLNSEGLVIFTDLFGGSPSNSVISKLYDLNFPKNVKCFVGVNLPVLLETIMLCSSSTIEELTIHLEELAPKMFENLTTKFTPKISSENQ